MIIGGGLVGASLAIALERTGVDVALVEAVPPGALEDGSASVFDQRNLSFSEATLNGLTALGVLQKLDSPPGAIERIHVTRRGDFGRVLLRASDYGRARFGLVVVARDFGRALEARLVELPRITRYRPSRFVSVAAGTADRRGVRITDADGNERTLGARLLVGADGTRSA
ncbi:MAG: FAD-dependent monooxygenase, partial [Pseudomonadota bacterium]|nr:FAD-dependent monooxygenase [Pseudomonadota bacterium]